MSRHSYSQMLVLHLSSRAGQRLISHSIFNQDITDIDAEALSFTHWLLRIFCVTDEPIMYKQPMGKQQSYKVRPATCEEFTASPYVDSMLVYCWASVADGGPTINQHWFVNMAAPSGSTWLWRLLLFFAAYFLLIIYCFSLSMTVLISFGGSVIALSEW